MNDVSLYKCLSNPTRLEVLKQLRNGGEFCVTDLIGFTGSEQSNLSHHLADLRACGLVFARQDGKRVCYKIAHPRLHTILQLAEEFAKHVQRTDAEQCASAGCC